MPGGDRTGPAGLGPMTGHGAGFCAGYSVPGFMNPAWGRGRQGRGWGGGGGGYRHRHRYRETGVPGWQPGVGQPNSTLPMPAAAGPSMTQEQELEVLKNQVRYFEQILTDLQNRINEVKTSIESSKTK